MREDKEVGGIKVCNCGGYLCYTKIHLLFIICSHAYKCLLFACLHRQTLSNCIVRLGSLFSSGDSELCWLLKCTSLAVDSVTSPSPNGVRKQQQKKKKKGRSCVSVSLIQMMKYKKVRAKCIKLFVNDKIMREFSFCEDNRV